MSKSDSLNPTRPFRYLGRLACHTGTLRNLQPFEQFSQTLLLIVVIPVFAITITGDLPVTSLLLFVFVGTLLHFHRYATIQSFWCETQVAGTNSIPMAEPKALIRYQMGLTEFHFGISPDQLEEESYQSLSYHANKFVKLYKASKENKSNTTRALDQPNSQPREPWQEKEQNGSIKTVFLDLPGQPPTFVRLLKTDNEFLVRLMTAILDNIADENFRVSFLYRYMAMSSSQLHRKVKEVTALTPSQIIRFFRFAIAKSLLINTEYSIAEISTEIGLKDPAYFTRLFTHEFGISPSKYRSIYKELNNGNGKD